MYTCTEGATLGLVFMTRGAAEAVIGLYALDT